MTNEDYQALLWEGKEVWNKWRKANPNFNPDLGGVNFSGLNLDGFNLCKTVIWYSSFGGSSLRGALLVNSFLQNSYLLGIDLAGSDLRGARLDGATLSGANLYEADLRWADLLQTDLSIANLTGANLYKANLTRANLAGANFTGANLSEANLLLSTATHTNFNRAILTGACIQDWNINSATQLNDVICDYVYLHWDLQECRPSSGNFAPGEFTKLFQKALETVDLIFRNGIDWDAFAYSFKKVEVENQNAQLDVQSIEKKGDGILVVRVSVSPNADKVKIHGDFMQGYELASKALEAQYQARLEDKEKLIISQEAQINSLIKIVEQRGPFQQTINLQNSQFSGGFVNAEIVQSHQIGGNIYNTDNLENPD